MSTKTVNVGSGVHLAYTDSGIPVEASEDYTTIFAIHGMCFTNLIFSKLQDAASANGYRFVAINRRPFAGSTAFSAEELQVITNPNASEDARNTFIKNRGHEIANFIDVFTQMFGLPPASTDKRRGGSVVLGWSMGSQYAAGAIAYADTLPADVQSRLSQHVRALVVYDAAPSVFGLPTPERNWAPLIDTSVPEHLRLPMFGQWVTGYFDNGDYSKRDLDALEYVLMSTDKAPSIFSPGLAQTATYGEDAQLDLPVLFFFASQLKTTLLQAVGGYESVRKIFPNLKTSVVCGDRTPSFGLSGLWAIQDALKGADVEDCSLKFEVVKGENHFLHWDNPQKALESYASNL